jgi:hypothetical protein
MPDTRHVILRDPYRHLSPSALLRFLDEQARVIRALAPLTN